MISLLTDSKIKEYDVLAIQESWRNAFVSTSYNSFNIEFYLAYHEAADVRICFYINTRLNVEQWTISFASSDVCTLKLNTMCDRIINIYNVYNASFSSYSSNETLISIETIKSLINFDEEHVLLDDFNLHHSIWSEVNKFTQHATTDQLFDVVTQAHMQLTLSQKIITWEARRSQNTINLIFLTNHLNDSIIHCMTRSNMNQFSDHISISTVLTLEVENATQKSKRAWKKIDVVKLMSS